MKDPPDGTTQLFGLNKLKTLKNTAPGPKYLIISRINSDLNLTNVSPFLIKKVIDSICICEVEICKKLRNGTILVKTQNNSQALQLIKLSSFTPSIEVEVTEHNTLNFSKGVIYCNDLREIPESDIQSELSNQKVCEVKKILKKVNNELIETGLIILKFNSIKLPEDIRIGYQKVRVRPYIPLPLKCNNCFKFGHHYKTCKSEKICFNCGGEYHTSDEKPICNFEKNCVNCTNLQSTDNIHSSTSKACPTFLREKEIQAIVTLQKVDRKQANAIYSERHPQQSTYASVSLNQNKQPDNNKTLSNDHIKTLKTLTVKEDSKQNQREQVDYTDMSHLPTNPSTSAAAATNKNKF